jgi:hypothetical protein
MKTAKAAQEAEARQAGAEAEARQAGAVRRPVGLLQPPVPEPIRARVAGLGWECFRGLDPSRSSRSERIRVRSEPTRAPKEGCVSYGILTTFNP